MSKADTLLKKATFFERMAIYSDRKTFLQALAQEMPGVTTPFTKEMGADTRQQVQSVLSDLYALNIRDPNIVNPIETAVNDLSSFDKGAMLAALQAAVAKYPQDGSRSGQLQNIQSLISKLQGPSQEPEDAAGDPMMMPADRITGMRSIDKGQQEALARFLMVNGITFVDPKKLNDGKLGPETRKGLNAFKQWYNAKATGKKITSDDEALQLVKYIVDNDKQRYGG